MDINGAMMRARLTGAGSPDLAWYVRHEYGDRDPTWFLRDIAARTRSRSPSQVAQVASLRTRFSSVRRTVRSLAVFLF